MSDKKELRGRPQKWEEGEIVRKTFILTPVIEKALKLKTVIEGRQVNELVREILTAAIEDKYFKLAEKAIKENKEVEEVVRELINKVIEKEGM